MTDFASPVGRLVQGAVNLQQKRDAEDNKTLLTNPDGSPKMGVFMALAFPKILPNGMPNAEFDAFYTNLKVVAAAAWPALFPQGPLGPCIHPRFSWKYQDGDGVDQSGKPVSDKDGFKGHHIMKFSTDFPVRCFHEGKFAQHEEIQAPETIIKRGYWVRIIGEARGNGATGTQVPGISLYPNMLSFVERGEEISSGPDAATAFGAAPVGWRPPAGTSPIPTGGVVLPATPAIVIPGVPVAPVVAAGPTYVISPALAATNVTIEMMLAQGWTHDAMVAAGYATKIG